jgi:two-component system OmpR family response regulator
MPRLLVVDDDPDMCAVLAAALEAEGFEVARAMDAKTALQELSTEPPDAVILDVMMPGMDGFELLADVRQRGVAAETRFLVVTCRTSERDHLRGWELGADDYVTKPVDMAALANRVRAVLAASDDELASRRSEELAKAALLDRLEAAMRRPSGAFRLFSGQT